MAAKRVKIARLQSGQARLVMIRMVREAVGPNLKLFGLSWAWVCIGAAATAGLALSTRSLVNSVFADAGENSIWLVTGAIVFLSLAKGGSTYFQATTTARIRRTLISSFQIAQFEKLLRMELAYFGGSHATEFVSNIFYAARGTAAAALTVMSSMVRDVLTLLFLVGVMVSQDPWMSLGAALIVPPIVLLMSTISRRIRKIAAKQAQLSADVSAVATETVEGIKVIKSFGIESKALRSFKKAVARMERGGLRINRTSALSSPVLETLGGITIGLFVLYASWQSTVNGRSPGEFVAFISAFLFAYEPAKRLAGIHLDLQKQVAAVFQYYELLDRPSILRPETQDVLPVLERGDIVLRNVGFSHQPDAVALQAIDLAVRHGERVAIVGRSGSGKTTLINLLLGFLTANEGDVTIDEKNVATIPYESLRRAVSLTSQEVFLFEGTIRENIQDGNPQAPAAAIEAAANAAQVFGFASTLPDGLDSQVGPNGSYLSGGQRQRVAIARALVKSCPVLVLDEATAALDGESEAAIITALLARARDQTVLCVSHRLSTIADFDRVIVLDEGRIVDDGPVEAVAARSELFRRIFHLGPVRSDQ